MPALGNTILEAKQKGLNDFNLKGLGIGDPLIDPLIQVKFQIFYIYSKIYL